MSKPHDTMNIPAISLSTNISLSIPTTITNFQNHHNRHRHRHRQNPITQTQTKSAQLDEFLNLITTAQPQPPSISTYAAFLDDCIVEKSILHAQKLYLHLLLHRPTTVLRHPLILSSFITLFSTSPDQLEEARLVLDHAVRSSRFGEVDESVWSALVLGYLDNGYPEKALLVYSRMLGCGVQLSSFTVSLIVEALDGVEDLGFGRSVHARIVKSEGEVDEGIYDGLLGFYGKLGSFGEVWKVFELMPKRNVVSWKMIVGRFVEKDMVLEAFAALRRMVREGVGFDLGSLLTVLSQCRWVVLVNVVKEIHARMVKLDEEADVDALNVVLDMYGICGEMGYCMRVFEAMEVKDLTSWNNVLNGYAINGCMREATELFQEMLKCGIRPDKLTFSALLTGCSHSRLIEEGQVLFDRMRNDFQIEPHLEHYACLVDLYGKRGRIEEALEMVKLMPEEPSDNIYGSLLTSCRLHGNISLAEEILEQMLEVGANNFKNYITMSNIYADVGMWEGVDKVRGIMEKNRIESVSICSWIRIKDQVFMFVEGGSFEPCNSSEFRKLWDDLNEGPDREDTFHGSIDSVRAKWACGHSERVATVFGLIHSAPGIPIRIAKNYLVCKACHLWMKNASKVARRKIILRDTDRFHHFQEGQCCCN